MIDVRCRPIDDWHGPKQTTPRRAGPYGIRWERSLKELVRELEDLRACDVTIGINATPSQIRIDGWPKAGVLIPPPVSITFDSRHGPLRFECDKWSDWKQNVRAICLTLQRLRLVDEGGVTRSGEQYRGFGALPPGAPIEVGAAMTVEDAMRLLEAEGKIVALYPRGGHVSQGWAHEAWRRASHVHHPDHGGDPAMFRRLTQARDLLAGLA